MKNKLIGSIILACTVAYSPTARITINDPTYNNSFYESNPPGDTIVYAIGVYETRRDHSYEYHPIGNATIKIQDQGDKKTILILSSYEPTNWNISGAGSKSVKSIYLFGYHDQSVTIDNPLSNVYEYSYEGTQNYVGSAHSLFDPAIERFESLVGDDIDAFAGSYRATDFTIQLIR